MTSLILSTASRLLLPVVLLFSIFILLRGHNQPGGGFVGGLIAAAAFALHAIAYGVKKTRSLLGLDPRSLIGLGLFAALVSGMVSLVLGQPFFTGQWIQLSFGSLGELDLGTPLVFDIGVYLTVIGVTLTIILSLAEEQVLEFLLAFVIGGLYAAGLYMMLRRSIVKLIIGLSLFGHAANLLIFTVAGLTRAQPPILSGPAPSAAAAAVADPLPQALILTAIVIGFGVQAFALVLIHRVVQTVGTDDLDRMKTTDT